MKPTLLDYLGVSNIWNGSPGLPYRSSNLPDKNQFESFKVLKTLLHYIGSNFIYKLKQFGFFKLISQFLNPFLHLVFFEKHTCVGASGLTVGGVWLIVRRGDLQILDL